MRLMINASLNYVGGGLQVTLSFIKECITIPGNIYYVLISENVSAQIVKTEYPSNFIFYDIPSLKFYQYNSYLTRIEKRIHPDIVFSIFGPVYWKPSVPHVMGFAIGHYIYDDSPYWNIISKKEQLLLKIRKFFHVYYLKRDASVLVCETDDVKKRTSYLIPGKQYFTVSNTCSSYFFDESLRNKYLKLDKTSKFRFLTIAKYYPHKNIDIIKSVIDELKKREADFNIQFVLTITNSEYNVLFGEDYKNDVVTVGTISSQECPSLYNECDAIFLPTLLECFSANYPEAMIMKKPILTSDLGFARTVCQNAALYFDPTNVRDIVDKIMLLINNPKLQKELVSRGLIRVNELPTARERAQMYLDVCKEIL